MKEVNRQNICLKQIRILKLPYLPAPCYFCYNFWNDHKNCLFFYHSKLSPISAKTTKFHKNHLTDAKVIALFMRGGY